MSATAPEPGEHYDGLGRALSRLLSPEGGPVVRVDSRGWHIVEYLSTGRLRTRTMRVGSAEYTAQVPETAPHRTGSAATLEELAAAYGRPEREPDDEEARYYRERAERTAEFAARDAELGAAVSAIMTERVLAAAMSAPPADPTQRRACRNCRGEGGGSHACACKDRGVHYLGVLSDPGDVVTDEPLVPEALAPAEQGFDPDCPDCRGTGTSWWTCPVCGGVGQEPACVDWHITGPDGSLDVRRDIAAMLRAGDMALRVHVESINRQARVHLRTDARSLARRVNAAVAEGQPTWVRAGHYFHDWSFDVSTGVEIDMAPAGAAVAGDTHGHPPLRGSDGPFDFALLTRDPRTGRLLPGPRVGLDGIAAIIPAGEDLLDQLQQQASGNPWMGPSDVPADSDLRGADSLVERVPHEAVVKMPPGVLFADALAQAADAGYALGLTYGFIATGQYGPSIYLLASDDRAISEIGSDYDWHGAIAEAHARLPKLLARLAVIEEDSP